MTSLTRTSVKGTLAAMLLGTTMLASAPALAQALINPGTATSANTLGACDDCSSSAIPIGFGANFLGTTNTQIYVNNNGNLTFGGGLATFTPAPLANTTTQIIAPFWADVDTRAAGTVTWNQTTVNGKQAFVATWNQVGYFSSQSNKLNTFQAVLINRSDTGTGNFDIEFNYGTIKWETGSASGGTNGLGGSSARAGFAGNELPGSAINGAFLDGGQYALAGNSNDGVTGQYVFQVRNGQLTIAFVPTQASIASIEADNVQSSATVEQQAVVRTVVNAISNRISNFSNVSRARQTADAGSLYHLTGVSAGSAEPKVGMWADGSGTFVNNSSQNVTPLSAATSASVFGLDTTMVEDFVIGLAVAVETASISQTPLTALTASPSKTHSNGYTTTAYAAYLLSDTITIDGQIGYGRVYNSLRTTTTSLNNVSTVLGNYQTGRLHASVNITDRMPITDYLDVAAKAGFLHVFGKNYAYDDSNGARVTPLNSNLDQVHFGGEVAVAAGTFLPYLSATYEMDANLTKNTPHGDTNGGIIEAGVRMGTGDLTGGLYANIQILRAYEDQQTFGANIRYQF